jgi:hypothetical protein
MLISADLCHLLDKYSVRLFFENILTLLGPRDCCVVLCVSWLDA